MDSVRLGVVNTVWSFIFMENSLSFLRVNDFLSAIYSSNLTRAVECGTFFLSSYHVGFFCDTFSYGLIIGCHPLWNDVLPCGPFGDCARASEGKPKMEDTFFLLQIISRW